MMIKLFVGNSHGIIVSQLKDEGGDLISGATVEGSILEMNGTEILNAKLTETEPGEYEGTFNDIDSLVSGNRYKIKITVIDGDRRGKFVEFVKAQRRPFKKYA